MGFVLQCLVNFGDPLGMKVNVMKSAVYIVGIIGPRDMSPFKYLGMPLATKKLYIMCRSG